MQIYDMKKKYDYLIIGAGFAGLSTAYHLRQKTDASICLVEREQRSGLGASGQNAWMICQIVKDPLLCRLMLESVQKIKSQWVPELPSNISFQQTGSFHLGSKEDMDTLGESAQIAADDFGIATEVLTKEETVCRFPQLSQTQFDYSLWCGSDGIIDVPAILAGLEQTLKDQGVHFQFSKNISDLQANDNGFVLQEDVLDIVADKVINAAGAWAGHIGKAVNAQDIQVRPTRRHVYVTPKAPLLEDVSEWPIVWDIPTSIYFRPDSNALYLCPCDETDYQVDPVSGNIEQSETARADLDQKLKTFYPELKGYQVQRSWAGLRTFSEDRRFVVGFDQKIPNFFWVACLGGYGMTSSYAVGELAADLLLGKETNPKYDALSPSRFCYQSTT